jgi:hypothetical protein
MLHLERLALELAVLSASRDMPEAVARLLGEYVHLGPRSAFGTWVGAEQRRLDASAAAAARVCALLEAALA